MSIIRPFKGIRPADELAESIAALPYDVYNSKEAREIVSANPMSFLKIDRAETLLPEGTDIYSPEVYQTARRTLDAMIEDGSFVQDNTACYYIYALTMDGRTQTGLVGCASIDDYVNNVILKHENTLAAKEEDRVRHVDACSAQTGPIFLAYRSYEPLQEIIDEEKSLPALYDFVSDDGIRHQVWKISRQEQVDNISQLFDHIPHLYIADGHHRYETALNYRNYCRENGLSKVGDPCDYQMIYLVDMEHPGLVVFPTHRLVRDLPDFNVEKVLDGCREYFDVTEMNGTDNMESELAKLYDEGKKAFGFYVGNGKWYRLVLKNLDIMDKLLPELSEPSRQLDVTVLHSLVLERIFGIDKENMANQINLTYTKFFSEAVEGVDNGKFQCSFVLNPTRVTEIRDVAATGEKMPQKSTYFYPKMITGMVMNDIGVE